LIEWFNVGFPCQIPTGPRNNFSEAHLTRLIEKKREREKVKMPLFFCHMGSMFVNEEQRGGDFIPLSQSITRQKFFIPINGQEEKEKKKKKNYYYYHHHHHTL